MELPPSTKLLLRLGPEGALARCIPPDRYLTEERTRSVNGDVAQGRAAPRYKDLMDFIERNVARDNKESNR